MAPQDSSPEEGQRASGAVWRWLAPDLAMALATLTLFTCLFLFGGSARLFRDSDTGWHVRTGEMILAEAAVPRSDPYSLTRSGQPWMAWEWASDVAMGALHRAVGLRGVAWLYGLIIAASVWLWVRLSWTTGGDFLLTCAWMPWVWTTAGLHWLARPHLIGWVWLMLAVMAAERISVRFVPRHGWMAFVLAAAWANTHASFVLGFVVLALYALGELTAWLLWKSGDLRRARWYALVLLCAAPGTLLNPYGWALHVHVFRYLRDTELLSRVAEFQSFNFHSDGAGAVLAVLLVTLAGAACAAAHRATGRSFVLLFFAVLAIRSARGLPLLAMCALPLANGSITLALLRVRELRPIPQWALDGFLRYSGNLRKLDAGLRGWAVAPLAAVAAWLILSIPTVAARSSFPRDEFPVDASARVAGLPRDARVLAPDKYGGYLIYRFAGERKVYFDGRSDFYGAEYMKAYLRLMEVRPGWRQQIRQFAFTHALLPVDAPLRAGLESSGWQIVYQDKVAVLLAAPPEWH
ncbi:MAG: hypothetical protein IPP47_21105 [Bryobacterales bacterium]|nr:hypothetical protein [Bryobacterales bacterium]